MGNLPSVSNERVTEIRNAGSTTGEQMTCMDTEANCAYSDIFSQNIPAVLGLRQREVVKAPDPGCGVKGK